MTPHRSAATALILVCLLAGFAARAGAGNAPAAPAAATTTAAPAATPDTARATMARWVETQQVIAKETRDWQQSKEMLQSRIALLKSEIAALEGKLKELQATGADADHKRSALVAEDQSLVSAATSLAAWAGELEGQLQDLGKRLPDPLREKVGPLYARMPADPKNTKVSLAERYQNVVGILNEVAKFNNEISMASEVRPLGGRPSEVKTVYVGLAQAYYLSAGGEAGIGRPDASGWQWEPVAGLAPKVQEVVEVLQSKASPKYVPLPVTVQ
jgi:Protein of unknown function (DUF3450)